jgi:hypothetical protein
MRLTELEPRFLRYEERLDTWTVVDRQPNPGEDLSSVPHHEVTAMRAFMPYAIGIQDAMGIVFLCPLCFVANHGVVGTHGVICWSSSRGVPETARPGPGRWRLVGTGFHDLSLMEEPGKSRSVQLLGGCNWHGFVTNGEVT